MESISLKLVGKLFQMSGPHTENECLPNWVLVQTVQQAMADLTVIFSLIVVHEHSNFEDDPKFHW